MTRKRIQVVSFTAAGAGLARRIAQGLNRRPAYRADCLVPTGKGAGCRETSDRAGKLVGRLFTECDGLVFVAAAGLVVRLIAPHVADKKTDPAVVVVDHAGEYAVSLLSGHLGGANSLARAAAEVLGGRAVITTATDSVGLPGWDLLAQKHGLKIANPHRLAALTGAWIDGATVTLIDRDGWLPEEIPRTIRCSGRQADEADLEVFVGPEEIEDRTGRLILRPGCLSVGIGCHRTLSPAKLRAGLEETLGRAGLNPDSLVRLASLDKRRDTPGLAEAARSLDLELRFFSKEELAPIPVPNPSAVALERVGVASVSEAAALAGWPESEFEVELIVEKCKWTDMTLALARLKPAADLM